MYTQYRKLLAKAFKDQEPDEPVSEFVKKVRDLVLEAITPTELTPWTSEEEVHIKTMAIRRRHR